MVGQTRKRTTWPTQSIKEHHGHERTTESAADRLIATLLHSGGVHLASEKAVVERALGGQPGVANVECNPVAQTTTVVHDPSRSSIAELQACIQRCGYDCADESVQSYINLSEAVEAPPPTDAHAARTTAVTEAHLLHRQPTARWSCAPEEPMGHGGHAGMSMAAMVRDMRNRFLVAVALSIPITIWSPIGRQVLGFGVPAPFGLRDDLFQLIFSLPVVFYSARIFFDGAVRALRQVLPTRLS